MSNKTNIEEDIKILENIVNDYKFKHSSENVMDKGTYLGLAQMKAIENILADRERLAREKEIHIKLEQQYKKEYLDEKTKYDSLVEKIKEEKERTINEGKADREKHIEDVMFRQGYYMALEELLDT